MKKHVSILLVITLILSMMPTSLLLAKEKIESEVKTVMLSPSDSTAQKSLNLEESEDSTYLIKYKDDNGKEKGKSKIKEKGGNIKKEFKKAKVVKAKLTKELLKDIKNDSDIECIEPDFKVKVNSEEIPWGVEEVGAPIAQQNGFAGTGIKIAVFDTGISKHQDLSLSGGISFVDGVESYADDNGHGTHVAGIISSQVNGQGIVGTAPSANLYAVKVIRADGSGNYSSIIEAIEWAIDNRIHIINMSFGGGMYSQILEEAINTAYQNNILMFASAGNDGSTSNDTITYPAKYANVISVGAVDREDNKAYFSSGGADLELVAPGVDIKSTLKDGSYGMMSGTSMACPHAVGVAALLWSKDTSVENSTIRDLLDYSAIGLGDKTQYGNGLVNASNALEIYNSYLSSKKDITNSEKKVPKKWKVKNNNQSAPNVNINLFFIFNLTTRM